MHALCLCYKYAECNLQSASFLVETENIQKILLDSYTMSNSTNNNADRRFTLFPHNIGTRTSGSMSMGAPRQSSIKDSTNRPSTSTTGQHTMSNTDQNRLASYPSSERRWECCRPLGCGLLNTYTSPGCTNCGMHFRQTGQPMILVRFNQGYDRHGNPVPGTGELQWEPDESRRPFNVL